MIKIRSYVHKRDARQFRTVLSHPKRTSRRKSIRGITVVFTIEERRRGICLTIAHMWCSCVGRGRRYLTHFNTLLENNICLKPGLVRLSFHTIFLAYNSRKCESATNPSSHSEIRWPIQRFTQLNTGHSLAENETVNSGQHILQFQNK